MDLSSLVDELAARRVYRRAESLVADLQPGKVLPFGASRSAHSAVAAALLHGLQRPLLVLTARTERVRQLADEIRVWTGRTDGVWVFSDPDALPYERVAWAEDTIRDRLAAMGALVGREAAERPPVVIASVRALCWKTMPVREFRASTRTIRRGQRITVRALLDAWVRCGYERASVVESPGTFSQRGGIIDVYSPQGTLPVRIELFGDEIDSIRTFDPTTQRSGDRLDRYTIVPAGEALPEAGALAADEIARWDWSTCHQAAAEPLEEEVEALRLQARFKGIEFYAPYVYSAPGSLTDYVPADAAVLVEDWSELRAGCVDLATQAEELREQLERAGDLPGKVPPPYWEWSVVEAALLSRPIVELANSDSERDGALDGLFLPSPHYGGQLRKALDETAAVGATGDRVVLVSRQAHRIADLLAERGIEAPAIEQTPKRLEPGSLFVVQGGLDQGWVLAPEAEGAGRLTLLTDAEVFGWAKPQPRRARRSHAQGIESFFSDVKPGDYVVHLEHGIGLFQGLVKLDVQGKLQEYLQVDFEGADRLYVPIYQADRLSRYVGPTDKPPTLSRLGSADWGMVKSRARRAVQNIARELLELYSAREVVPGYAFGADTAWQVDLESSFPYVETEDQIRAIHAVKTDMMQTRPMDRLICGDVGYGKTEVALRAAFKAVNDGKQVAVLVPTTVLAKQHFETFRERLAPFPVTVEMLSRFRKEREQQEILKKLTAGGIDIVVGTHRLIQKDVEFKDLGLLIIDEEQRFGVQHKERLKRMRKEVDVLTLTATPIPRTLYMSMTGVRDMSTIDTPPEERLPIKTYVGETDDVLIRKAILRELDRDGQVYFVHNRVHGIEQMAQRIRKLVPEATVQVGHGQMPEGELERVMLDFVDGKVDVLVCTSIIESGLDIPNANTIIINRADALGLAQLYQLRGRVGRSAARAYAYLLYPRLMPLSGVARKRLDAIAEAGELGAGFRIAMRDLEIRGAGELLGARQHGHISAIGFDLYCRLLAQAVREVKGEAPPKVLDDVTAYIQPLQATVQISLPLAAYVPEEYVPEDDVRLELYRRFAGANRIETVIDLEAELADRFGTIPEPVQNLLFQVKVKVLGLPAGAQTIAEESEQLVVRADSLADMDRIELGSRLRGIARVSTRQVWLQLDPEGLWRERLENTLRTMGELRAEFVTPSAGRP